MSMLDKLVRVVFKGDDQVTEPANKAKGAVSGFSSVAGTALKALGAVAAGLALGEFFRKAVDEAEASRETMAALAVTVRNSGASFEAMQPQIDATFTRLANLTKFGDDDFAAAMQAMTLKTGDAGWALDNLSQAADLAAASNIPLEKAADALAMAHEGNTKQLFKLIPELKGAANWQELLAQKTDGAAEAQMRALGPFAAIQKQFGEVAEAVGKAILGNSEFSEGGFQVADMLANLAGWIEENTAEFTPFITALVEIGKNLVQAVAPGFRLLGQVASPVLKLVVGLLTESSFALRAYAVFAQDSFAKAVQAIAGFGQSVAGLLRKVGIDINTEGLQRMQDYGQKMETEADGRWTKLQGDHKAFWTKMTRDADDGERGLTNAMATGTADQTREMVKKVTEAEASASRVNSILAEKLGPPLTRLIGITTGAIRDLGTAADTQLKPEQAEKFAAHMATLAARAKSVQGEIEKIPPNTEVADKHTRDMADSMVGIARGALDAAVAFGVVDEKAASSLTSVINMGEAIGRVFSGDIAGGVTGIIGAMANIVASLTSGSRERKELERQSQARLRENTLQMVALTKGVGLLALDVQGGDVATIESILSELVPQLAKGGSIADFSKLINGTTGKLVGAGLGWDSIVELAKKFGMNILDKDGAIDFAQLPVFLKALQGTNTAAPGTDFRSQLDVLTQGFGVRRTSDVGQIGGLLDLGDNFSPILKGIFDAADIGGTRDRLADLFDRLSKGQINEADLGQLTGTQFRDLILDLITRIDNMSPGEEGVATDNGVPGFTMGGGGGGSIVAVMTLTDVVDAIASQTDVLAPVLVEQLAAAKRTADNTEQTVGVLARIEVLLAAQQLSGDAMDAQLERLRRNAATNAGRAPAVR